ncbi:MAG TPA: hypothetical protein VN816_01660 [Acidimicrobiales bacterium]|nr:hypothetical protein [Acidimicrobiales bacterium]
MACWQTVATGTQRQSGPDGAALARLRRRTWPVVVTVAFVCLATAYVFRWGSVVQGQPSSWLAPDDLWTSFAAAVDFIHGHPGAIYSTPGFLAFPGVLILLAPLAALGGSLHTTLVEIGSHHHLFRHPRILLVQGSPNLRTHMLTSGGNQYFAHPQVLILLAPYVFLLSCSVLFACDALAERLQVTWSRRAILALAEAAVLWNVVVFWGHPEDAISMTLVLYAVLLALDERWVGAGWLFGAAMAVQPLVIVILPILLAMGGRRRALTLVLRGAIPAVVVTIPSLVSSFHATVHTLTSQPAYPRLPSDHRTPWTFLAPKLGGRGTSTSVGGGPLRLVALALAVLVGWWARRWKNKPDMLLWATAVALALRCYTESVMTAYYVWPALAVGLVVAARATNRRFVAAIVVAVGTTIVAQWHLGEWPWWALDVAGVTGLLVVSARPEPSTAPAQPSERRSPPRAGAAPRRGRTAVSQQKKRKLARTNRKSARR